MEHTLQDIHSAHCQDQGKYAAIIGKQVTTPFALASCSDILQFVDTGPSPESYLYKILVSEITL